MINILIFAQANSPYAFTWFFRKYFVMWVQFLTFRKVLHSRLGVNVKIEIISGEREATVRIDSWVRKLGNREPSNVLITVEN